MTNLKKPLKLGIKDKHTPLSGIAWERGFMFIVVTIIVTVINIRVTKTVFIYRNNIVTVTVILSGFRRVCK